MNRWDIGARKETSILTDEYHSDVKYKSAIKL